MLSLVLIPSVVGEAVIIDVSGNCYPGNTGTDSACMQVYDDATNLCMSQEQGGTVFPAAELYKYDGGDVDIVYLTDHGMKDTSGQEVSEEIWFTRKDQNVPYMQQAISDMDFQSKSADEVNAMLELRASAVVGMQSQGPNARVNIGRTAVKQMDPNGSDKSGGFFRPCWNDFRIDNVDCHFTTDAVPFVQHQADNSYKISHTGDEFPFVGLGFTFDWMKWHHRGQTPEDAVGLNEHVILPNRGAVVEWTEEHTLLEFFCGICDNRLCGNFSLWMLDSHACPSTSTSSPASQNTPVLI